jgi:hypothetical protein
VWVVARHDAELDGFTRVYRGGAWVLYQSVAQAAPSLRLR